MNDFKFKPFDKVLVREGDSQFNDKWKPCFYFQVIPENYIYCDVIPYEGNEHLENTTEKCKDERKTQTVFLNLTYCGKYHFENYGFKAMDMTVDLFNNLSLPNALIFNIKDNEVKLNMTSTKYDDKNIDNGSVFYADYCGCITYETNNGLLPEDFKPFLNLKSTYKDYTVDFKLVSISFNCFQNL